MYSHSHRSAHRLVGLRHTRWAPCQLFSLVLSQTQRALTLAFRLRQLSHARVTRRRFNGGAVIMLLGSIHDTGCWMRRVVRVFNVHQVYSNFGLDGEKTDLSTPDLSRVFHLSRLFRGRHLLT